MGKVRSLLAFDVGNSSVKCALRGAEGWEVMFRIPTAPIQTLEDRLAPPVARAASELRSGALCVASSVCPEADGHLAASCNRAGLAETLRLFGRDVPVPIVTLVRDPSAVGTDRLLCALGALAQMGAPCVVVGVGTAVTVDLVDAEGRFAGGAIAPGPALAARALHEGTACLPLVEPDVPQRAAGLDTTEAIRAGIYWFCKAGVRALVERLAQETAGGSLPVAVTGGDAHLLLPLAVEGPVRHVPDLIFLGMEAALQGAG